MKKHPYFLFFVVLTLFIACSVCSASASVFSSFAYELNDGGIEIFSVFDSLFNTEKTQENEKKSKDASYSFQEDYEALEECSKSVFYVEIYDDEAEFIGSASGFVSFDEHLFVTNQHVIEGALYLKVWDENGNCYVLYKVLAVDERKDIAILEFPEGKNYDSLDYSLKAELKRGQPVTTIGSPQGMQNTVAFGNISATPTMQGMKMIQFTAPISQGSSGGVLFDNNGTVIGMTSSILKEGENIGFAIPIDEIYSLYKQWDKKSYFVMGIPKLLGVDEITGAVGQIDKTEYQNFNHREYLRNPKYYQNKKLKVTGTVDYVMKSDSNNDVYGIFLATKNGTDNVVFVMITNAAGYYLQKGDIVTIYGTGNDTASSDDGSKTHPFLVAQTYDQNLNYKEYLRNPEYYQNKKLKVTGTVVRVMKADSKDFYGILLATKNGTDNLVFVIIYDSTGYYLLEDDIVTIYGTGNETATSDDGSNTIPFLVAHTFELLN